jgi:uncharacterized protein YjbI with pentapeptide repeats
LKSLKKFVFKRRGPDLPGNPIPTDFGSETYDIAFSDARIDAQRLVTKPEASLRLEASILQRVSLANCTFSNILMKDVRLVDCDLANLQTRSLTFLRVEFINCRMTGMRAGEAEFQDLLISEGDQRYAQFRHARFKAAEFDRCNLSEADFLGADLTGSIFRKCNLQNVEMSKVKLMNADLRGSTVEGLHMNAEDIRGATVDLSQAIIFAPLLGIRIE